MIAINGMLDPLTGETVLAGLRACPPRPERATTARQGSGVSTHWLSWLVDGENAPSSRDNP